MGNKQSSSRKTRPAEFWGRDRKAVPGEQRGDAQGLSHPSLRACRGSWAAGREPQRTIPWGNTEVWRKALGDGVTPRGQSKSISEGPGFKTHRRHGAYIHAEVERK